MPRKAECFPKPCLKSVDGTHIVGDTDLGRCCELCGAVPLKGPRKHTLTSDERLALVDLLIEREGGLALCFYCERPLVRLPVTHKWAATLDHFMPSFRGGSDAPKNLVLACAPCNHRKGNGWDLVLELIRTLRAENDDLWIRLHELDEPGDLQSPTHDTMSVAQRQVTTLTPATSEGGDP